MNKQENFPKDPLKYTVENSFYGLLSKKEQSIDVMQDVSKTINPLLDESNNIIDTVAALSDIEERKKYEEKVKESEEIIKAMFDSIAEAIVLCDLDGVVQTINETAARRYGRKPEEIISKCLYDFMPKDLAQKRKHLVDENIRIGKSTHFYDQRENMDFDNAIYPIFNSSGKVIKFVALTQDITERNKTELLHQQLAAIIESCDEAIIGKTLEGIITSWNNFAYTIYGYTAEEAIGQSIEIIVPPSHREELKSILSKIKKGERIIRYETIRQKKDGTLLDVSMTLSPILDLYGNIVGSSSIAHDISERKKVESDLAKKSEELKVQRAEAIAANKLKSQFLANMSHELRTPLNSIIGFTTRVIKKSAAVLPPVQLDNLKIVKTEAKHLLELINGLLDYSKIESGKMEVFLQEFNLVDVVHEVNSMIKTLMDEKKLKYEQELFSIDYIPIISDCMKVKQILINLLSNAIKYSEKGRVKLSINLLQQFYCIKVEDEGIGISAENIDKIFDKFTQLDGSYTRKFGGTGLGLSITKEFVKMLGGRIEVKSTLGTGSCFTVLLPVNGSNAKNHRNEFDIEKRTDGICKNEVIYVDTDENFTRFLNDHIPKPIDEDYFEEVLKRWLGDKL